MPLEDDLGIGGDLEIDCLTLHQAYGFAEIATSNLEFIEAISGRRCRRRVIERVVTDEDRHRHRLIPGLVFDVVLPGVARVKQNAGFVRTLYLETMEAQVPLPSVGILCHNQP